MIGRSTRRERGERFAGARVRFEGRVAGGLEEARVRLANETQRARGRDVRVARTTIPARCANPRAARSASRTASVSAIWRRQRVVQDAEGFGAKHRLVEEAHRLVGEAARQGGDPQRRRGGPDRCAEARHARRGPARRARRGSRTSRPAPCRRAAAAWERGATGCAPRSSRRRPTRTTGGARRRDRTSSARSRRGGRRASRTGR